MYVADYFVCVVQNAGRTMFPHERRRHVRNSHNQRRPDETPPPPAEVPVRRALVWGLIGAAIVVGLVLYFLYARLLQPLAS